MFEVVSMLFVVVVVVSIVFGALIALEYCHFVCCCCFKLFYVLSLR